MLTSKSFQWFSKNNPKKLYILDSRHFNIEALMIPAPSQHPGIATFPTKGGALRLMFQLTVSKPINHPPKSQLQ